MTDTRPALQCAPIVVQPERELADKTRVLAEREHLLRESEAQYRLLFAMNPHPLWIVDPSTRRFLEVNEQAVRHYGYTLEEFLAMTLVDLCAAEEIVRLRVYGEDAQHVSPPLSCMTGEWRHRTKDGTIIDVELSAVPVSFKGREAALVLGTDITKRKAMEAALRRSEQLYRLLIEHFPNGTVALFDQDLRYRLVGGTGLAASGVTKERFEGKTIWEAFPAALCQAIEPCYRKALTGHEAHLEVSYMNRVLLVHTLPISDDRGNISTGIVVTQDITRHKRRESRLRRSEQRYRTLAQEREQRLIASDRLVSFGELAASLAHEFNNPLGIAMGFAQDVLSETPMNDVRHRRLQIIVDETRRCGQLMKNLLELAAPPRTTLVATDLTVLITHSLELISGRAQKNHITTAFAGAPGLPKVQADPQQLEQVLLNLYFNAIEAMPEGGILTVELQSTASRQADLSTHLPPTTTETTIAVHDTGCGIAPADLPKIFHSFFTTKKQRGMGLGLSICEGILRAHEGRLTVHSTLGHGTTFVLHLPMRNNHDAADA